MLTEVYLIPAYQCPDSLRELVRALRSLTQRPIIVVDDGSTPDQVPLFQEIAGAQMATLLRHSENLGKGAALKTGFNYTLVHFPGSVGIVTLDADGQHIAEDALLVGEVLCRERNNLILGCRQLGPQHNIPFRSLFGNKLTRHIFRVLTGKVVSDTQTGLRGIPAALMASLLRVPSSGYEFETEMLLLAVRKELEIRELPIRTLYREGNSSSHFNPLLDSIRIGFAFLRFALTSKHRSQASMDWNLYYQKPFKASFLTRKITIRRILDCFRHYGSHLKDPVVVELGGGGGCAYGLISGALTPRKYIVVDNNATGLNKFTQTYPRAESVELIEENVLNLQKGFASADICFSIGLIEHFSKADTQRAIRAHFKCVTADGLVLITFPTPTWLYRLTRALAEWLNLWRFPDERPCTLEEIVSCVEEFATVEHRSIIWPIFLTQGLIVAKPIASEATVAS